MAKILILAQSGFGKSTSIGKSEELGIEGLNPKETYIISATSKPLPFRNSATLYKTTSLSKLGEGNRVITNDGDEVAQAIRAIGQSPYKNIVIDDSNYIMQDYYMQNAKKTGYDIFKVIGSFMANIFSAMEEFPDKNFIMLAHFEEFKDSSSETISYRFKTVGKMVQDYITPEGKFDIVLYGKQYIDDAAGKKAIKKVFVTEYDGQYPAKSAPGMFDTAYILNDLGLVIKKCEEYYGKG